MTSTFMGLEIARRGMTTQQSALYVTSQNVANANTPGYSRQRVNFEATEAYPFPGMNQEQIPGQMGTGVKAGSIQRVREGFLDLQYRTENNKVGYWQARSDSLSQLESILNEPSDTGLSHTMDQFWQSLQDLADDPTNSGARSVVLQRGEAVADTFNYLSNSLSDIQKDQKDQIDVTVKSVNSILDQLNGLNQQISRVEPNGLLPNDLYDERDRLIDQLSSLVNIKVTYDPPTTGVPDSSAEGIVNISLVDDSGSNSWTMLDKTGPKTLSVDYGGTNGAVTAVKVDGQNVDFKNSTGKLKGLIEAYGYDDNGQTVGIYPDMLSELDNLAFTFATNFNAVQEAGISPNDIANYQAAVKAGSSPSDIKDPTNGIPFFEDKADPNTPVTVKPGFAGRIQISHLIKGNINDIATASGSLSTATLGDASNVTNLANVISNSYEYKTNVTTDFQNYYQNVIGSMGVNSQEATRMATNSTSLQQAVDERRQSVSSVSLDEEMTNMIQYQHAYSASAKMISVQNDILDTIINGMGVGR